jgi:cytochrome c oxidase cbb3-type subunit 3
MKSIIALAFLCLASWVHGAQDWSLTLDDAQMAKAAGLFEQNCALCHGADRSGYAADHAPSLKSPQLLSTGFPSHLFTAIGYGRKGTAMAAYSEEMGGPLAREDINLLTRWLLQVEGIEPLKLPGDAVEGDAVAGAQTYSALCANCHGDQGQGVYAPAIGDQSLLANASDAFLKYALEHGRDGTPMGSYSKLLGEKGVNNVVAYLRSQASGWAPEPVKLRTPPTPDQYVLNPEGDDPEFTVRVEFQEKRYKTDGLYEGRYVPAAEVVKALEEKKRFILLDTRPASAWQRSHIPGAVPMPYYRDKDRANDLQLPDPSEGVMIVAYCACPHAASDYVINNLRALGYPTELTAVIDEGILVWTAMGLPVVAGEKLVAAGN